MTEREKAALGLLYNTNDEEMLKLFKIGEENCFKYNQIPPDKTLEKNALLLSFIGKIGKNPKILSPFKCDLGFNISIGDDFFANVNLVILDAGKVTIGNNVYIGPNVGIYTPNHSFNHLERAAGLESAHPITIGNNVWIGGNVVILPGVSIGDNVIVGAGSVVTKDIPDKMLVVGNPARILRAL